MLLKSFSLAAFLGSVVSLTSGGVALAHSVEPLLEVQSVNEIGDCGGVNLEIVHDEQTGVQRFDILTPALDAEANATTPRIRRFCNIRAKVKVPDGYRVRPLYMSWQGAADINGINSSANLSGRFFFSGAQGIDGFKRLLPQDTGNFEVELNNGFNEYSSCGGVAEMNFLADVTVRTLGQDPSAYSEVKVQRLYGEADQIGQPIYHCGYIIQQCP